jgi:ubiquinol-cytochrome c reductase cytochrome b subunit
VLGSWLAFLVFGGEFPSDALISRLYVVHILLVPALIIGLLTVHMSVLWRQKHTQFPGRGRREDNVVGSRLWPTYAARSIGLFAFVTAVLCLLGGLAQINPVWLYGPYSPSAVSTAAQPDWYMGWLEGALRVMPAIRLSVFGYRVPEILLPAVVLPGVTFLLLYLWPFLEARVTGEGRVEHHLLDRPRDRPVRTALGAATLAFYVVLMIAGGQDVFADKLDVSIRYVTWTLRIALLVVPPLVGLFSWKLARDLARGEPLAVYAAEGDAPVGPADTHEVAPPEARRRGGRVDAIVAGVAGGGFVLGRRSRKVDVTVLEVREPRESRSPRRRQRR